MAQILTDNAGNIITWTAGKWMNPGEYANPIFRLIEIEIPDGYEPTAVVDFGVVSSATYETSAGPVLCEHVYADATVELTEVWQ